MDNYMVNSWQLYVKTTSGKFTFDTLLRLCVNTLLRLPCGQPPPLT